MADSEARAQRAAALVEKRRRLEELKARRSRRTAGGGGGGADGEDGGGGRTRSNNNNNASSSNTNLDDYIDGLLANSISGGGGGGRASLTGRRGSTGGMGSSGASVEGAGGVGSSLHRSGSGGGGAGGGGGGGSNDAFDDAVIGGSDGVGGDGTATTTTATTTTAMGGSSTSAGADGGGEDGGKGGGAYMTHSHSSASLTSSSMMMLSHSSAAANAAKTAKEVVTFAVGTQTVPDEFPESPATSKTGGGAGAGGTASDKKKADGDIKDSKHSKDGSTDIDTNTEDATSSNETEQLQSQKLPKVLNPEQVEQEVTSRPFSSFINTASKKMERVLSSPYSTTDLLANFIGDPSAYANTNSSGNDANDASNNMHDSFNFLSSRQVYECAKWTETRDVTDLDWSPLHRELLLSTYHMPGRLSFDGGDDTSSNNNTTTTTGGSSLNSNTIANSNNSAIATGGLGITGKTPGGTLSSSLTPRSGELQADGLALVWSLTMPHRPEHIFTTASPVTAGRFHPTEGTLIIGGCESGQLVVWDVRSGRLPVQKSTLKGVVGGSATKGHTHPITQMEIIEGGAGLCTASYDGRVNFWSLSNLREPAESILVGDSVSCFTVAPESECLLLADEHGGMYAYNTNSASASASASASGEGSSGASDSAGGAGSGGGPTSTTTSSSTAGGGTTSGSGSGSASRRREKARKLETSDSDGTVLGHYGMVTALSAKTLRKGAPSRTAGLSKGFLRGMGGLVLSSGVDWTVKLWAPAYTDLPIQSMVSHSYDYMSDAQWSPTHPSLFCTASSNGKLALWNLAKSFEEPITGQDDSVKGSTTSTSGMDGMGSTSGTLMTGGGGGGGSSSSGGGGGGIVVEPDAIAGRGLSKVKWSRDGRRIAVASGDRVHVLNLTEEVTRPVGDEESKTMNYLLARGLIGRQ